MTTEAMSSGIPLDGQRQATQLPVARLPVPAELVLPLQQHIGTPAEPVVAAGERVVRGQPVARARGFVSAGLHAPVDAVVQDVVCRPVPHPSGLSGLCVVLSATESADWRGAGSEASVQVDGALPEPDVIRSKVRQAGIVGLGGATFPTSVKIKSGMSQPVDTLIINGCECEPWITCDEMLLYERPRQVIAGCRLLQQAVQAERCVLAVEDDAPEMVAALRQAVADCGNPVELAVLPARYPSGSEKQLISIVTGKEVPSQDLPADIGVAVYNVGTAAAVYQAVVLDEPLISRFVSVSGPGIEQPRVVEALLGTPVSDLIGFCGGRTKNASGLLMGGAMMGLGLASDEVPVTKGMNSILVTTPAMLQDAQGEMPCIRCGECARVCPARLAPQQLLSLIRSGDLEQAQQRWALEDCIECGCCNAVCPSHIPLASYYRYAKSELRKQGKARVRAQQARQRYEFRMERIEHAKREREEKLRKKKEALQAASKTRARAAMAEEARAAEEDGL